MQIFRFSWYINYTFVACKLDLFKSITGCTLYGTYPGLTPRHPRAGGGVVFVFCPRFDLGIVRNTLRDFYFNIVIYVRMRKFIFI